MQLRSVGLRTGPSVRTQGTERDIEPAMAKTLVIVESPAKAKTIKKYLGAGYEVIASKGHVKDLPKKMGIDMANGFEETYEVIETKAKKTKNKHKQKKRTQTRRCKTRHCQK